MSVANAAPVPAAAFVATPDGLVGVQQLVLLKAPKLQNKVATVSFSLAGGTSFSGQTAINSVGFGGLPWTPNLPGTWTISSSDLGSTTIAVAAIPTTTTLLVPNQVGTNNTTTMLVQVASLGGMIAPSGTVTVRNQSGQSIATGALAPSGLPLTSSASMPWTPEPGAVSLTATFTPATAAFGASVSPVASPMVGANPTIAIDAAPAIYLGVPTTLRALTGAGVPGGAAAFNFTKDGFLNFIGGSNPIVNGAATFTWTPTLAGYLTLGVQYASTDFRVNGQDAQPILVRPAPSPDSITVAPSGAAAWGPGVVGTLTAGNTVTLSPASQSGNPVTLVPNGPCVINAGVLTVLSVGTCTITATSLGNAGALAATTATYTVNIAAKR
jgi:hypothetical protein